MTAARTHLEVSADAIKAELLEGRTQSTFSIKPYLGAVTQVTLTHLVACDFCDTTESPLRAALLYIGSQARAGEPGAVELLERMAQSIAGDYSEPEPEPEEREHHSVTSHEEARIRREPV